MHNQLLTEQKLTQNKIGEDIFVCKHITDKARCNRSNLDINILTNKFTQEKATSLSEIQFGSRVRMLPLPKNHILKY
jgi:hypothetical protein